jgi:serine/threonine-protein kinase
MLSPGVRLGSLEVLDRLGAGGMGEVYRARDTRLGREVAVKVLPEPFRHDAARLTRLEGEARLLAVLNHPGIAAIHGLEYSDSVPCLILELVGGPTLAEQLRRGALPVGDALELARQICDALESAHERGVIHCDLKPANIKVTDRGRVKLLDFGVGRMLTPEPPLADHADGRTATAVPPDRSVVGTLPYMSPEQVRGENLDRRTDVWAFGCVLFEMLTGERAFPGATRSDVVAALHQEPDWTRLPAATPGSVRTLLRRCLRPDRYQRLRDIGDARLELEEALTGSKVATRTSSARGRPWLPWLAAAAATVSLAVVMLATAQRGPSLGGSVMHLSLDVESTGTLGVLGSNHLPYLRISPDGTSLVYAAHTGGRMGLYLRAFDSLETRPISGTEEGFNPFFSPDGRWVGYFAQRKLKKVPVAGGAPQTLCDAPSPRGGTWTSRDTIVFAPKYDGGLWEVPATGGDPVALTILEAARNENSHRWPEALPDGQTIIFTVRRSNRFEDARVEAVTLGTAERRTLLEGGTFAQYAATGHLVYGRDTALLAVPFDLSAVRVTGSPARVMDGLLAYADSGAVDVSLSRGGVLAYVPQAVGADDRTLLRIDEHGRTEPLPAPRRGYETPRLSPDGKRLALAVLEGASYSIWTYELGRGTLNRLTIEQDSRGAVWHPDGRLLAFTTATTGAWNLFLQPADASTAAHQLVKRPYFLFPTSWSRNGRFLAYTELHSTSSRDIWILDRADGSLAPFVVTPAEEMGAMFSPDGRWIAYSSNESGVPEVYVRPFPGPGGRSQISTEGGAEPVWSPDGQELFYREGGRMMAVGITQQPVFAVAKPRALFDDSYRRGDHVPGYDVWPGRKFIVIRDSAQAPPPTRIHVVINWFADLQRQVAGLGGRASEP